ncbi:MAG TPA: four-helix bundle copper-binding protein, partial [Patescibacteria group bacterium]|nr:four-helix bundle copper-binding protein [Patescibacteria group bacterium]
MLILNEYALSLQNCIDTCIKCAQACNKCFKACLEKDHINEMKEALSLLVDCAEMCYVTAAYMSKDNIFSEELSSSCAELCEKCASICEVYEDLHCQASVKAC